MSDQLEPKNVVEDSPINGSSEQDSEKETPKKIKVLQYNRSDLLI
jgi:hypothetical protein